MRRRRNKFFFTQFYTSAKAWMQSLISPPPYLGIDLGSYQARIYVEGRGIVFSEKTAIVYNKKSESYIAFGDEAYEMIGKTPPNMVVSFPINKGRVSDFDGLVYYLDAVIKKALYQLRDRSVFTRFNAVMSVPIGLTEVEEMALVEVGTKVGAGSVYLIETPLAAGIGLGAPVMESSGTAIIDIGGGTTELSIVSLGGVVISRILKSGGVDYNEAISNYVRLRYGILIGTTTAEEIKFLLGSIVNQSDTEIEVSGRSIETGMPKTTKVKSSLFYEALYPFFGSILDSIKEIIEETPPELIKDIQKKGFLLTGGSSQIIDLNKYLSDELNMAVIQGKKADKSVVAGLGWLVEHPSVMKRVRITF